MAASYYAKAPTTRCTWIDRRARHPPSRGIETSTSSSLASLSWPGYPRAVMP